MQKLLSEYQTAIEQFHPALLDALRPGLDREFVVEQLSRLPFKVSDEAIDLYCWADGMDGSSECLIPYAYLVPLETAIQRFEHLWPNQGELDENYGESFPILSDGSDGGYGLGSIDEPCNGKIIEYNIHDEWTIGFDSLSDLIATAIEAYKRGLVDEDGEWCSIQFSDLVDELYPELKSKTADSNIKITPPEGWYLSSDGTSLSKDQTTAFMTEIDSDAFEHLRRTYSVNVGQMRDKGTTECTESEVRFSDSAGWKFVFNQIEVSELVQINYLLAVSGGHVWVKVHSDVLVFDDVEFETALETLELTASASSD